MSDDRKINSGKITVDLEMQDIINAVSKSGGKPYSEEAQLHKAEGEDLKKAWFNYLLISLEKLNDHIEKIRGTDLVNLRTEMREDIAKAECEFKEGLKDYRQEIKDYKTEVIAPLNEKISTMNEKLVAVTIKLGLWSVVAGFAGSGVMALLIYILKEYWLKPAITGGP